jgi:hypothetical protein
VPEIYRTPEWASARDAALARDNERCTVSRLFGGDCHSVLHVHHVTPVAEGGAPYELDNLLTTCASHHPMLEGMRRYVLRKRAPRRCPHNHRYPHAREECERRLAEAA